MVTVAYSDSGTIRSSILYSFTSYLLSIYLSEWVV
jgi:hypothetical protein